MAGWWRRRRWCACVYTRACGDDCVCVRVRACVRACVAAVAAVVGGGGRRWWWQWRWRRWGLTSLSTSAPITLLRWGAQQKRAPPDTWRVSQTPPPRSRHPRVESHTCAVGNHELGDAACAHADAESNGLQPPLHGHVCAYLSLTRPHTRRRMVARRMLWHVSRPVVVVVEVVVVVAGSRRSRCGSTGRSSNS